MHKMDGDALIELIEDCVCDECDTETDDRCETCVVQKILFAIDEAPELDDAERCVQKELQGKKLTAEDREDREMVIDALVNCTRRPKCQDCPWEECEEEHMTVELPLGLALAALRYLREC